MRIVDLATLPATAWHNGGGVTRVLASGQATATRTHADGVDWRISLADIGTDGPFSTFAGIDRHALLLGNGAVELHGPAAALMARPGRPIHFPGELALDSRRQPGTVKPRFLNLMVRRSMLLGAIEVVTAQVDIDGVLAWALLPLDGTWQAGALQAASGQALLGQSGHACLTPHAGQASAALLTVRPLP